MDVVKQILLWQSNNCIIIHNRVWYSSRMITTPTTMNNITQMTKIMMTMLLQMMLMKHLTTLWSLTDLLS